MQRKFWAALGILLLSAGVASAHGEGLVIEKLEGQYKAEMEIGAEAIEADTSVRLDFELEEADTEKAVKFTDSWIVITQTDSGRKANPVMFAGAVKKPDFGAMGFTFVFPRAGSYTAKVRYHDGAEKIVEAEIPFMVEAGPSPASPARDMRKDVALGGGAFVGGYLASILIRKFLPRAA